MIRLRFREDLDRIICRTEFACCHSLAARRPYPSIWPGEVAGILIALSMLRHGLSRQLPYRQHCSLSFGKMERLSRLYVTPEATFYVNATNVTADVSGGLGTLL